MNGQRIIAVLIILTSSLLSAHVLHDFAYPGILCILGLLGVERKFTWDIRPERRVIRLILLLVLLVVFGLHYRFALIPGYGYAGPTAIHAWQTVTRYFLASMILMLYLGNPHRLPLSLGLFFLAIILCAGQLLLLDGQSKVFRPLELLAVACVILFVAVPGDAHKRGSIDALGGGSRRLLFVTLFLVTLNVGWIVGSLLYRYQGTLNSLGLRLLGNEAKLIQMDAQAAAIGFSNSGELSSLALMKTDQDLNPILKIKSASRPEYLRAKAFEIYRNSAWKDLSFEEAIFSKGTRIALALGGMVGLYPMKPSFALETREMTIEHLMDMGQTMFTPLTAYQVEVAVARNTLMLNDNNLVYNPSAKGTFAYRVFYDRQPYRHPPQWSQRRRMLKVPPDLDPAIHRMAERLFVDCHTTAQKKEAVIKHFRDNYDYSLDISPPANRDKLTYFLLHETSGYCEYFASGAAILLRLAHVPTRYVTGFYVTDRELSSNTWIARNINAHAWVEAWDAERRRWDIVEATVQAELTVNPLLDSAEGLGHARFWYQQLLQSVSLYGVPGLFIWLYDFGGGIVSAAMVLAIGAIVMYPILRFAQKRWKAFHLRRSTDTMTSEQRHLKRLLRKMDMRLRSRGLRREPQETINAFSRRLDTCEQTRAARWYDRYGALRFRARLTTDQVGSLRQAIS